MLDRAFDRARDGIVDFFAAGTPAQGQFRCAECGYGIIIKAELPTCPMCASTSWEGGSWALSARPDRRPAALL